jgi:hypothetical protein
VAAAISIERNTLERRRAHHFDILVNRLARVAFDDRHLIDRQDREIDLQTGLGAVRVVEVDGFHCDRLACADGLGDFLRQLFFFGCHAARSLFCELDEGRQHLEQ